MGLLTNTLILGGAAAVVGAVAVAGRGKSDPLKLGEALPDLTVTLHSGEKVNLASERTYQLIYFFPKASTPGCTKQACSLSDAFTQLVDEDVSVYGVSTDGEKDLNSFRDKYALPFDLISDRDGKLARAFGVPLRFSKFPARQAFLFKDGKLIWRDLSASTAQQAADVIKVLARQAQ